MKQNASHRMNKPREIGVSHRFSGRRSTCARGIVLLEVLVALGLLVMGLAVVGLQINAGLNAARSSDRSTRAVILAESKMAELRAGVLKPETQDEVLKGDFGVLYPGYTWLMFFEETETEGLLSLTMHICFDEELRTKQIDDPEMEVTVDERDYQPVYTVHRLYPENVYLGQKQDPFSGSDMGGFQQDSGGQQDENGGDGPPGESGPDGNNGGGIGAGSDFMLQLIQKVQSGEIDLTQFDETQSQIIDNAFKMFREGNFDKLQAYILSNQDEFSDLLDLPEDAQ